MAFCGKCGAQISDYSSFCSGCGTPVNPQKNADPTRPGISPAASPNRTYKINITETLFRPFKDPRWIQKTLIGGLIALIPLIGGIFLQGYIWLYCRRVISGNFEMPEWDDWGEMLRRGFGVLVIGLIYAVIPLLIALLLGGITGIGVASLMDNPSAVCGVCIIPLMVILALIFLCFFFYPLSLTVYAGEKNLSAAFDFPRFGRIIATHFVEYVTCYLALFVSCFAVMIGTWLISIVLLMIICLGWIALLLISGAAGLTIGLMATSTFGEFYRLRVKRIYHAK